MRFLWIVAPAYVLTLGIGSVAVAQDLNAAPLPEPSASIARSLLQGEVATDPAKIIRARVGQAFAIGLRANRTTGFAWQLEPPGNAVQSAGSAYEARSASIGGGGQELWLFRAVAPGATNVTFRYVRPFEKGASQMERATTFRVEIAP